MIVKTTKRTASHNQIPVASLSQPSSEPSQSKQSKQILLMGNPNVGKSVIFSALTRTQTISSNYAGTTMDCCKGIFSVDSFECSLTDLPGIYSLQAESEAERIALNELKQKPDAIICVLDATNLAQGLHFALEISSYQIPMVYLLNLSDVAKSLGISIDIAQLKKKLNAPVIQCIAVKESDFTELKSCLSTILTQNSKPSSASFQTIEMESSSHEYREDSKQIAKQVSDVSGIKTVREKLEEILLHPILGLFSALLILSFSIIVIIGGGEFLIEHLSDPLSKIFINFFRDSLSPLLQQAFLKELLIGDYGVLVTPFEWILASILPYVFMFYLVFSFLEDSGYLPRLCVLFDRLMNHMGLQGGSMIPILLGYGCAVPAIIGTRTTASRKERLIAACIICFAVPCTSQTGALLRLFHGQPVWFFLLLILISVIIIFTVSFCLKRFIKGEVPPMMLELPHLLLPNPKSYFLKLKLRMNHFLLDAEIPMMAAILLIALISASGLLETVSNFLTPLVVNWLGLPKEASLALITGMIRREMSVAPLLALSLSPLQLFVGGIVSLLYLPCASVFAVLVKEFNLKTALLIAFGTVINAFLVGGLVHFLGNFIGLV